MKKKTKKRLRKIKMMKIRYGLICFFGLNRYKYLKKHNVFGLIGENVLFQPTKLPNNPKLIKLHNNVKVAADVTFYEHDVINQVFRDLDNDKKYTNHLSCIEVFDNVFIGGKSIIIGNVKIGPNVIVGAGSVVTKDIPEGVIVAGNPAKVIGSFEILHNKRKEHDYNINLNIDEKYEKAWEEFYKRK